MNLFEDVLKPGRECMISLKPFTLEFVETSVPKHSSPIIKVVVVIFDLWSKSAYKFRMPVYHSYWGFA